MNLGFRARRTPPGRAAGAIGTIVVHTVAAAFLFSQVKAAAPGPPVYAVELVAAPAPTQRRRVAREAVPTPPPAERPAPVTPKPTPPPKQPAPEEPKPPPRTEPDREPPPPTSAPVTPAPGETPSTGTDVATIKTPGLEFPFPEYLRNIVTQIYTRWDRDAGRENSFAEISFFILRDGSIRDIHFVSRSGSFGFDLSAQGAIEAAGNAQAFGPLPDGWEADVLPVSFYFKPTTR
ncbi:MAG TPA: TonB C-terminal domain-containing protein [Gemmatimonadales bacterium]|nr:TonB C-terminal domain-containing protein [Gemmatimonadales bacterium]